MKWTLITNVGFVDTTQHARLWCKAVLIDREPSPGFGGDKVRQIRGLTWGGMHVFTVWIDPGCTVEILPTNGGANVLLSHDGTFKNLDGGALVRAGDCHIRVNARDYEKPLRIEELDQPGCPFGDELDQRLVMFEQEWGYRPLVQWVPVAASL